MNNTELIEQLEHQAELVGVSSIKLRAIYQRGIDDCMSQGYPESPMFHGLARVQRFINAYTSNNSRMTLDADMLPRDYSNLPKSVTPHVVSTGEWPDVYNLLSFDNLSTMFPDEVYDCSYDIDEKILKVSGKDWLFEYNLNNGDANLWYNF